MPDAVAETIEEFQEFLYEAFENDPSILTRANEKFSDLLHVLEANRDGADDGIPPEFAKQLAPSIDFVRKKLTRDDVAALKSLMPARAKDRRLAGDAAINSFDFFKTFPQAARLR